MNPLIRTVLFKLAGYAALIGVAALITIPQLYQVVTGQTLPSAFNLAKTLIGATSTIFAVLVAIFNVYLWKTFLGRLLLGWPLPDLQGTWRGLLTPTSLPPHVDQSRCGVAIPAILVVRQSAFTIRLTMYTGESSSVTVASEFTQAEDPSQLVYSYDNTPQMAVRTQSPQHLGTAVLSMSGARPGLLSGSYFTDRLSRGDLRFEEHSRILAGSIQEAQNLTYTNRSRQR